MGWECEDQKEFDWTNETHARKLCAWTSCELLASTIKPNVIGHLVYYWRAGSSPRSLVIGIEGGNVWVSHRATAIKCAQEQLRVASPAEREMREMLMRIGGDDPDERSKNGVPRQQDLT